MLTKDQISKLKDGDILYGLANRGGITYAKGNVYSVKGKPRYHDSEYIVETIVLEREPESDALHIGNKWTLHFYRGDEDHFEIQHTRGGSDLSKLMNKIYEKERKKIK